MNRWLAILIALPGLMWSSSGFADTKPSSIAAGDRVRYARPHEGQKEGTVVVIGPAVLVVDGDYQAWRDSVRLGSLQSLEVRSKPFNMGLGFMGGIALGALAGAAVAGVAVMGSDDEWASLAPIFVGAPIGALVGGVIGLAYSHDRGTHWKQVSLPSPGGGTMLAPNELLQPMDGAP